MKRILYSGFLKFCAFIIACAALTAAVYELCAVITRYGREEKQLYRFEESFDKSDYFNSYLWGIGYDLETSIEEYYRKNEKEQDTFLLNPTVTYSDSSVTVDYETGDVLSVSSTPVLKRIPSDGEVIKVFSPVRVVESNAGLWNTVEKVLESYKDSDVLYYYISVNGKSFTNKSSSSGVKELTEDRFFLYVSRDAKGNTEYESGNSNHYATLFESDVFSENNTQIVFCAASKEEYVEDCEMQWYLQCKYIRAAFTEIVGFAAIFLMCVIYLICVCGKNGKGETKSWGIDKIWTEVLVALLFLFVFVPIGFIVVSVDEYLLYSMPKYMLDTLVIALTALPCAAALTMLMSLTRKAKHGTFFESSLVFKIMRFIMKLVRKTAGFLLRCLKSAGRLLTVKTGVIYVSMLVIYTAFMFLLGIGTVISPIWLFFAVILFVFVCMLMLYRANELEKIREGAKSVRSGNLTHKIENIHSSDLKLLTDDINDIAKGLDESVSAKLKAERLKTDLITNVSHDLKTPLTSIINYTELLSGVENLPEQASDYVSIISKKAARLKQLTQDLFDISKVQSGNESINFEKLDFSLLINQSLGEHDSEIVDSGLNFCVDVKNELFVMADGRKMSRVISNLISNILKYSMKNTRVYITAYQKDGKIIAEFKNISNNPLNFDCEEITGRFVRGDESRSLEGNGLGLAIAKSYTQACNGRFDIVTDADLFKAVVEFDEA